NGYTYNIAAGSTIELILPNQTFTATVDNDGSWSVLIDNQYLPTDGKYTVSAQVIDAAGNTTTSTRDMTIDTEASIFINPISEDNIITAQEATENISVTGMSSGIQSGQTVAIDIKSADGSVISHYETLIGNDGTWAITIPSTLAQTLASRQYTLTATASDIAGNNASATQNIAVNALPVAVTVTSSGNEDPDAPITIHLTGSDSDGSITSFTIESLPSNGVLYLDSAMTQIITSGSILTATNSGLNLYFQPNPDWNGTTQFNYASIDNLGDKSPSATATINISAVNDAPVNSVPTSLIADEDVPLNINSISVHDVDGNLATTQLTVGHGFLNVSLAGGATISAGANGSSTLTLSGTETQINAALATLNYTGNTNYNGADTLTIVSTDSSGNPLTNSDTDTISITVNPVNDAPVAVDDLLSVKYNTATTYTASQLLGNDSDVDGDKMYISSVAAGTGGTVMINSDGTITFTPYTNFNGIAHFTYTVTDGNLVSNSATVTVNVIAISSISSPSIIEGGELLYDVSLSNPSTTPMSFNFSLGNGTASSLDYETPTFSNGVTLSNGVLTVPAGVTSFTVTVPTVDDALNEANETVPLTIGGKTATGTIIDNDAAPSLS
ncbi:MAG: tandem-95 repeat protein, partial [Legionella sp.]